MQRLIETVSLFVLVVVTALRPLISESYDSAGSPITEALGAISEPSPVRTLVFDVLILLSTAGWLLARAIGPPRRYRRTGLEIGAGLVAIAAVVSCLVAGNKRLAINGSIDWLCYPLMTMALVQLLHCRWRRRLLLAAVLASACAQAGHCMEQYLVGFDETWEHYQGIKEDFWANQGVDLDSAKVVSFERRILGREATGFMPHGNVTGSHLVLCGVCGCALAIASWKRSRDAMGRLRAAGATAGAAWIIGAAVLTGSVGALIAGLTGIALWLVITFCKRWIDAHRTRALIVGWLCVAGGMLAVVGYGICRDSLPGWSLTFRWQYWRASAALIADYPLTGVGRENFGRHYLGYKLIESPEEVANPHNLFVQAAADWGIVGLIGIVAMLVGASRVVCSSRAAPRAAGLSPRGPSTLRDTRDSRGIASAATGDSPDRGRNLLWGAALLLALLAARLPLIYTDDPKFFYFAYYTSMTVGLCWLIGFVVFGGARKRQALQAGSSSRFVSTGVAIGLFTFLLHDIINFATFVPGTATTFFALLAVCIAERSDEQPVARRRETWRRWLPLGAVVTGVVFITYSVLLPVARADYFLSHARQSGRELLSVPITAQVANDYFERAAQADPLDPTPRVEQTRWLMALSTVPRLRDAALGMAASSLQKAIERDPFRLDLRRMQIRLHRARAESTGSAVDHLAAVEAARKALELYPRNPSGLAALGDCQLEAGEATLSDQLLLESIVSFERALKLDNDRLAWEELRRFRDKERDAIRSGIVRARRLLQERR